MFTDNRCLSWWVEVDYQHTLIIKQTFVKYISILFSFLLFFSNAELRMFCLKFLLYIYIKKKKITGNVIVIVLVVRKYCHRNSKKKPRILYCELISISKNINNENECGTLCTSSWILLIVIESSSREKRLLLNAKRTYKRKDGLRRSDTNNNNKVGATSIMGSSVV